MIKGTRLIQATLVLAIAIGGMACNQQKNGASNPASTSAVGNAIVYVNSDSLLANYEFFQKLQEDLKAKTTELQKQVQNETKSFQGQVQSYQQKAPTMTASERQNTEQNLARKQQELQTLQQKATQELMQHEQSANEDLYKKVQDYMKEYAAKNHYKYVLTYSRGDNTVLFADSTLDVTDEVIKGLNEQYKAEKK